MVAATADPRSLPFAKLQCAGNGYVAFDASTAPLAAIDWPELARRVGRANFGVGSDGILVAEPARTSAAKLRMRVFNSDGSEAEMSGNGIRLFAKFALERGLAPRPTAGDAVTFETGGGLREVWPQWSGDRVVASRVSMDAPRFELEALPAQPLLLGEPPGIPAVDLPLDVAGRRLGVTLLSLGNPHAVTFIPPGDELEDYPLEELGPLVQQHEWFPRRVNFEVAQVVSRDRLRARIFERGEGETMASGTGSTAVVVAAHLRGTVGDRVEVELRGGLLCVEWPGSGPAYLEGPSEEVFTGEWPLD